MKFIFHFIYGMSSFPLTNSYFFKMVTAPPTSIYTYIHWNLIKMGSIWTSDQNQDVFYMKTDQYCISFHLCPDQVRFHFDFQGEKLWDLLASHCQLIGGFCRYLVGLSFTVIEFDPLPHFHGIYISYLLLYTLCQFNHFQGIYIFLLLYWSTDQL